MGEASAGTRPISTGRFLLVGFGGLLGLIVIEGLDSLRVLHTLETRHTNITKNYLARNHALQRLQSVFFLSGTVLREYIDEPDREKANGDLARLKQIGEEMNAALQELDGLLTPEERSLFLHLRAELLSYWNTLSGVFRWDVEQRRARGEALFRAEVIPRRTSVLAVVQKLSVVSEQTFDADLARSAELFSSFRRRTLSVIGLSLGFGLLLAGLSIGRAMRLERQVECRLRETLRAREEMARLSARLVEVQETERRAISRELHDEVGQSLSALLVDLGNLGAMLPPDDHDARRLLSTVRRLAEGSLAEIRNMALLLRPSMLDDLGLEAALKWQAREHTRRTGTRVRVSTHNLDEDLPDECKTCVFRVVQEALHNCARHANAQAVLIEVRRTSDRLLLTIQDDGKGFDPTQTRGLGLIGMEERVKHLGGQFHVHSQPGQGVLLTANLPLAPRAEPVSDAT